MSDELDITDIRSIRVLLLGYEGRCDQVLDALKDLPLSAPNLVHAKDLYLRLKTELKLEAARHSKRLSDMSGAERCFSEPAIRKAVKALKPHANSNPQTTDWMGALMDARGVLSHYLQGLNERAPESTSSVWTRPW